MSEILNYLGEAEKAAVSVRVYSAGVEKARQDIEAAKQALEMAREKLDEVKKDYETKIDLCLEASPVDNVSRTKVKRLVEDAVNTKIELGFIKLPDGLEDLEKRQSKPRKRRARKSQAAVGDQKAEQESKTSSDVRAEPEGPVAADSPEEAALAATAVIEETAEAEVPSETPVDVTPETVPAAVNNRSETQGAAQEENSPQAEEPTPQEKTQKEESPVARRVDAFAPPPKKAPSTAPAEEDDESIPDELVAAALESEEGAEADEGEGADVGEEPAAQADEGASDEGVSNIKIPNFLL